MTGRSFRFPRKPFAMRCSKLIFTLRKLATDRRGTAMIVVGFSAIPMTVAVGMSIDYARAAKLQTKLNSIADASALAAVTTPMMSQTSAEACAAARRMFVNQINGLDGLIMDAQDQQQLQISVTDNASNQSCSTTKSGTGTAYERIAKVTYTAQSKNSFGGMLGLKTITIGGLSQSDAKTAPNMDFYFALDTSLSMALPTTSAGIQTMDSAVKCSFACHSNKIEQYVGTSLPSLILDNTKFAVVKGVFPNTGSGASEKQIIDANGTYIYVNRNTSNATIDSKCKSNDKDICIYNSDGTYVDSYWYALNKSVRLRVTDERNAVTDLMSLAQSYADTNHRSYRAALYTFDHKENLKTIVASPSALSTVSNAVPGITVATVNDKSGNGCPMNNCTGSNRYLFTSYKSVLDKMSTVLPSTSGQGSDAPGDTPQAFLFLVTDGMSDEDIGSGRTRKAMQQDQINQCTAIKTRGIKIAILYTEYTVESIKDDEANQRAMATAAIPDIAPQLTKCASPDLMYTVKTDQSISDALQALFTKAVKNAQLTQ